VAFNANAKEVPLQDYAYKMQVGVKGEIVINAGIYKGRYASRVEDIKNDIVGFAHPLIGGALLPAYRDLNFDFVMEDGSALYVFPMSVRRVEMQSGLPVMWADMTDYPQRIQRRQFLRVSCLWDILVFHMGFELREPMSSKWMPAKAIDISLGGYRFKISKEEAGPVAFETEDQILVYFTLYEKQYALAGKATRIVFENGSWEVGVSFDSLPAVVEKKLFEFIRQQEIIWRDD
jgi:c-di-GMP-binding flagellar brake protein YcgR